MKIAYSHYLYGEGTPLKQFEYMLRARGSRQSCGHTWRHNTELVLAACRDALDRARAR